MVRFMSSTDVMTSPQVAQFLKKGARTIQRMATDGTLPYSAKLPGKNGAFLFSRKQIEAWAAENPSTDEPERAAPTPEPAS